MIAYINQLYNDYPTNLIHIPLSEDEIGEMSYYDALGLYASGTTSKSNLAAPTIQSRQQRSRPPRDIRWWRTHRW
jgi:hypothetical protein